MFEAYSQKEFLENMTSKEFILNAIKPFFGWISFLFIISITSSIILISTPYLLKVMVDRINSLPKTLIMIELINPASLYIVLCILRVINTAFYDFVWMNLKSKMHNHIGIELNKRMINHTVAFYQNNFSGSLVNKINDVMVSTPNIIRLFADHIFGSVFTLSIAIYVLFCVNNFLALYFLTWSIIFIYLSLKYSARAKKLSQNAAEIRSKIVGNEVDLLNNIFTVKLFDGQKKEMSTLKTFFSHLVIAMQKRDWYFLCIGFFQGLSFVIFQVFSILSLLYGLKSGSLTSGDFVLVLTLNLSLIQSLLNLAHCMRDVAEDVGNLKQGLNLVLSKIGIKDSATATELFIKNPSITYKNVKFSYSDQAELFNSISITIPPGQKVGLVGFSGSGKTTFVNLLLRLYEINAGSILIDAQDIRGVSQESLRKAFSVIPQDPSLFHRTILENIRYGSFEASNDEVIEAAQRSNAHEFIMQLPSGYDSCVGEKGVKLSGGQRQKIALSRAFLRKSPIIILDEATSQLDSINETFIQKSIKNLFHQNRQQTMIIIAHRLSTLGYMDRILFFKDGKIIEDGTHEELIVRNGMYKKMWDYQHMRVLDEIPPMDKISHEPNSILNIA